MNNGFCELTASTTFNPVLRFSPELPTNEDCMDPKSNAIVGISPSFPIAFAQQSLRCSRRTKE
jgi:hypothetical protein